MNYRTKRARIELGILLYVILSTAAAWGMLGAVMLMLMLGGAT